MRQSICVVLVVFFFILFSQISTQYSFAHEGEVLGETYAPEIKPENFSSDITNKYLSLPVGRMLKYQATIEDGRKTVEVEVLPETKQIDGVETRIYQERILLNGVVQKETEKYLAQDSDGGVWYFGESVNNFVDGVAANQDGSWIAGEGEAQPGIWIPGKPEVAVSFKQKFLHNFIEDTSEVVSTSETVETPFTTYTDCLQTFDTTPIDPLRREHSYYCPEVGALVLTADLETGTRTMLVQSPQDLPKNSDSTAQTTQNKQPLKSIALQIIGGICLIGAVALLGRKLVTKKK